MHVMYLVITILASLANGYAASLNFSGAESGKVVADRVRVSRGWMVPLGALLAFGARGLLTGFAVPALGTVAAIGLVLYFICAVGARRADSAERLAFVLHDVFGVPFADIATAPDPLRSGRPAARQPRPPARAQLARARP
jgi:hypothetical protein